MICLAFLTSKHEITSATALPKPPIILCSSTVTNKSTSFAHCCITSLSIGFIVGKLYNPVLIPTLLRSITAK